MPKNKKLILKKQELSLKSADDGDVLSEFEYDGSSDNNSDEELRDELAAQNEENEENQEIEEDIVVPKNNKKNINKIADSDESDEDGTEEETETEADAEAEAEDTDINENDDDNSITNDEECLYRNVSKKNKKKDANIDDDDESQDSLPDDDIDIVYDDDNVQYNEVVKSSERITKPFLTTFERVRLICDRAKQLSLGAKPMIKMIGLDKPKNPKEIAKLELETGVMPLIVERVLPNGKKEQWKVSELKIIT
jgi:DNA-directed RNA polymerase subunit K/omega